MFLAPHELWISRFGNFSRISRIKNMTNRIPKLDLFWGTNVETDRGVRHWQILIDPKKFVGVHSVVDAVEHLHSGNSLGKVCLTLFKLYFSWSFFVLLIFLQFCDLDSAMGVSRSSSSSQQTLHRRNLLHVSKAGVTKAASLEFLNVVTPKESTLRIYTLPTRVSK